jgi:uncharacterized coiled-coil protein SlyX
MAYRLLEIVIEERDKVIEAQRARIAKLENDLQHWTFERFRQMEDELAAMTAERDRLRHGLTWTTKQPTKAGWYWFRGNASEPADDWCIFQVWEDEGVFIVSFQERPITAMMTVWVNGEWAGPIPEPTEGLTCPPVEE